MPRRQIKEPVRLREKSIKGGRSLYLDIYSDGKREYEFLKMYLIERPKNAIEKEHNQETLAMASAIKAQRVLELHAGKYNLRRKKKGKAEVAPYFEKLSSQRKGTTRSNWIAASKHLDRYHPGLTFAQITPEWVRAFRNHLLHAPIGRFGEPLSKSSSYCYFNRVRAMLKQAHDDGFLSEEVTRKVPATKQPTIHREFLTVEELQKLTQTECAIPLLKKAFLFSAMTGLRWSDIEKLTWSEVRNDREEYYLTFNQKKTDMPEVLPISAQAREILGTQGSPTEKVFENLNYSDWLNTKLQEWVIASGITKKITFHNARHSFATLMLSAGTDIYTVSKMLGHSEIRTTQIYAKLVDAKKREAVNNFPKLKMGDK